ncbi:MAG: long-chain-fatty-acid--CoA ligase [Alphaproteobacteria bacterium]|nr:long-chain-fatty-acid--CoA ligase [Alphaproteobacteria bacterium]
MPQAVDWIAHHARVTPQALAQVDLASGRRFTYREMNDRVGRLAAHLISLGVCPGDRVGFLAMNSTDIMEAVFATWRIGAVSLALNFRLTAPELEFIVNDAGPKVLVIDQDFAELASELRELTDVPHWLSTDGRGGQTPYEDALAAATPLAGKTVRQPLSDQCMLMYSSGTTGRPKGVIISHEMMLYSAVHAMAFAGVNADKVNFAVMPLFHIGGLNVFTCPVLYAGGATIIQRSFEPGAALDVFNDPALGVTHFLGVPAIYNALKLHPKNGETDFSRLECALAGAEAVPDAIVHWWHERGLKIQEGYGMTETAASSCMLPRDDVPARVGSAGKALMHCEMKIMGEDRQEAAPGELGELWMRGPVITPGYWNRPDANEESFVEGWFRSGDIAKIDAEGYVYIEDRLKDMYISGGENVYPAEVENVLYELDAVAEVAVIGVPDSQWGEVGCAIIAVKEGHELNMADIAAHCETRLAKFKRPAHMTLTTALPRNATGKVLKFELRKSVPEQLDLK